MSDRYNDWENTDLMNIVADLKRRIENLESGNRIGNTAIDKGILNVNSGSFTVGTSPQALFFGTIAYGSGSAPGWIFRRADGSAVFALLGTSPNDQFWAFYDKQQNIIISDDAAAGQGLALPFLPIPFVTHSNIVPELTTTSGTFVAVQTGRFQKQHPKVQVDVLCRASDGTTAGEVRLVDATHGGSVIAGPSTISAGAYALIALGPAAVYGNHTETMEIEVQIRRTSGAGTIGARTFLAYGKQS